MELKLNRSKIGNLGNVGHIANILKINPNVQFRLDCPFVSEIEVADHLNGRIDKQNNSPLFALNSIYQKTQCVDVALVQCFFGQDKLQYNAVKLAMMFMAMSNPKPMEWVFVEAQRSEKEAMFKWVSQLGCKYMFVKIQNDKQDYFIKEQLWNIGAKNTFSNKLVFVDADVAYCQMDWLKHVKGTFDEGVELFQPHAWSWRADEPNDCDEQWKNTDLGLVESFANRRKHDKSLQRFNGHTGYDIAITRAHYRKSGGFWSVQGTGGDFLNWTVLAQEAFLCDNPMGNAAKSILKTKNVKKKPIGCSELTCFHNFHGDHSSRTRAYERDLKLTEDGGFQTISNFDKDTIGEMPR